LERFGEIWRIIGRGERVKSTTGKFGDAWWGMFNRGWLRAECFVVTSSDLLITGSRRFVQWLLM
jgi:hypothetical protein